MKFKKWVRFLFSFLVIALIASVIYFGYTTIFSKETPTDNSKYSQKAKSAMKNINIDLASKEYSKTVEKVLEANAFNEKHAEEYYKIEYKESTSFVTHINQLLDKSYSGLEINQIFQKLNTENIAKLVNQEYVKLDSYYDIKNLNIDNMSRYEAYRTSRKLDYQVAVTRVNIKLDKEFYTEIETIAENKLNDTLILVNKYNALPADYVPSDMVSLSFSPSLKMKSEAAGKLEQLLSAAKLDGGNMVPYSAYRSYSTQNSLYNNYSARDGSVAADKYSARPGHSEHQTGLAVDIRNVAYNSTVTDSEYAWLKENAHKYGFIIRYTKDSISITGYQEEPWHLRYIGIEHATKVKELGLTYDEYYNQYIEI